MGAHVADEVNLGHIVYRTSLPSGPGRANREQKSENLSRFYPHPPPPGKKEDEKANSETPAGADFFPSSESVQ